MFYTIFVFVRVVVFFSFFFGENQCIPTCGDWGGIRQGFWREGDDRMLGQVCDILTSCTRYISETNDPTILL